MKLEHRREKVVSLPHFFRRMWRYITVCAILIIFSVSLGTVGYHFIAKLAWFDSFHMTCMILTGMGPVAEMKNNMSKLFSSFYALYSGIAFLSITAVFFAPIVHRVLHILNVENEK